MFKAFQFCYGFTLSKGIEPLTSRLTVVCSNQLSYESGKENLSSPLLAGSSFDLLTFGLWAQHAASAPPCFLSVIFKPLNDRSLPA